MSAEHFVTVTLVHRFKSHDITMPGATTGRYAAKRLAEAAGLDPDDRDWGLADTDTLDMIRQDDVIANWEGKRLSLRLTGIEE